MSDRIPPPAAPADGPDTVALSDVLDHLRHRWVLLLVFTALAAGVGGLVAKHAQVSYTAVDTVLVAPISQNPSARTAPTNRDVNMPTEVQVATSQVVARRAAQEMASGTSEALVRRAVQVSNPSQSLVLVFRATGRTGKRAVLLADAAADAYLGYRSDVARQRNRSLSAAVEARAVDLEVQVATLRRATGISESSQVDELVRQIVSLRERASELSAAPVVGGQVLSRGRPEGASVRRRFASDAVGGLLLGGVVGAFLAILLERRSPRVLDLVDLERELGLTTLGVLASATSRSATRSFRDRGAETAHVVAVKLLQAFGDDRGHCLAVVDASAGGAAATIARALADLGVRTAHLLRTDQAVHLDDAREGPRGDLLVVPVFDTELLAWHDVLSRVRGDVDVAVVDATSMTRSQLLALVPRLDLVVLAVSRRTQVLAVAELVDELRSAPQVERRAVLVTSPGRVQRVWGHAAAAWAARQGGRE